MDKQPVAHRSTNRTIHPGWSSRLRIVLSVSRSFWKRMIFKMARTSNILRPIVDWVSGKIVHTPVYNKLILQYQKLWDIHFKTILSIFGKPFIFISPLSVVLYKLLSIERSYILRTSTFIVMIALSKKRIVL